MNNSIKEQHLKLTEHIEMLVHPVENIFQNLYKENEIQILNSHSSAISNKMIALTHILAANFTEPNYIFEHNVSKKAVKLGVQIDDKLLFMTVVVRSFTVQACSLQNVYAWTILLCESFWAQCSIYCFPGIRHQRLHLLLPLPVPLPLPFLLLLLYTSGVDDGIAVCYNGCCTTADVNGIG